MVVEMSKFFKNRALRALASALRRNKNKGRIATTKNCHTHLPESLLSQTHCRNKSKRRIATPHLPENLLSQTHCRNKSKRRIAVPTTTTTIITTILNVTIIIIIIIIIFTLIIIIISTTINYHHQHHNHRHTPTHTHAHTRTHAQTDAHSYLAGRLSINKITPNYTSGVLRSFNFFSNSKFQ